MGKCSTKIASIIWMFFIMVLVMGVTFQSKSVEAQPFAYLAGDGSESVFVIDTATNMLVNIQGIAVGNGPFAIAITPDGSRAYVAKAGPSNNVSVIDTATNMVVGPPIGVGDNPFCIAITPDGSRAYVTNFDSGDVWVIDTVSNMVVDTIDVGGSPYGIAITPDGLTAYVAHFDTGDVSVIDTVMNGVIGTTRLGLNQLVLL